ncbi:hypothetical protein M9Y10_017873 [Tritrichomonas musculus]|uniref:Uncharacterized protein n=1 Tax=Tritrichomonas musculus TaxID=1915356 RepID=A0ABR2HUY4_9EUKA
MQSIALDQNDSCKNEEMTKIFSFILLLPQKWKASNNISNPRDKVPNIIVSKYSRILEQLFVLPPDNANYFLQLDLASNSHVNPSLNSKKNRLKYKNKDANKEFMQNLLYLSTYQSIYNFLMKLVLCNSSQSVSFFEKINFTDILIEFLFQKENFTNKKIFDQTIRLIDNLISNLQVNSPLITPLFNECNKQKDEVYKILFNKSDDRLNSIFCSSSNSYQSDYPNNITIILDLSLYNDSNYGIDLILSVQSLIHQSNQESLNYINKLENIEKLYRFLEQKINKKQFDATTNSSILLLASIMNDIFCNDNFEIQSETKNKTLLSNQFKIQNNENCQKGPDFITQTLQELQFLDNYRNKNNQETIPFNNSEQYGANLLRISAPIYSDENNANQGQNFNTNLTMNDRNCLSLGTIQEGTDSFSTNSQKLYSSNNQFETPPFNRNFGGYSSQKVNHFTGLGSINEEEIPLMKPDCSNEIDDESADDESNSNENIDDDEGKEKPSERGDEGCMQIEREKPAEGEGRATNEREDDDEKKTFSNEDISDSNSNENDSKKCHKKRINHTSLRNKDIEELINYSSSSSYLKANESQSRRKQPLLIPAIPNKPNQPMSPARLRSFASLNNINSKNNQRISLSSTSSNTSATTSSTSLTISQSSYDRVVIDNNSGYSSNYYKASISSSNSAANMLQTGTKNSFTVTTGLGSSNINMRSNVNRKAANIPKRNSYSFISPLKSLIENSQNDLDEANSNSSQTVTQYTEDVFPTTIVETVVPEYAKEMNLQKNQTQIAVPIVQTAPTTKTAQSSPTVKKEEEEKVADSKVDSLNVNENDATAGNEGHAKSTNYDDVSATPRATHRRGSGKKRSSFNPFDSFPCRKRSRKGRTSLPPSSMMIQNENKEPLSLLELATSSEILNLDNFSFKIDDDLNINIGSMSGPISRVINPEFRSPFRKSHGSIAVSNSFSNMLCSKNLRKMEIEDNEMDNADGDKNKQDVDEEQQDHFKLGTIKEEAEEEQPKNQLLEEIDNDQEEPFKLGTIKEDINKNQQSPFQLDAINEEGEQDMQQTFQLGTINEDINENQQSPFQLDAINEEAEQDMQQTFQLGTINEEDDEQIQNAPQLEAISEDFDEDQQSRFQLGTINEEAEGRQQQTFKLGTINEEAEGRQQQTFKLGTINEEAEDEQPSQFELGTIAEEADEEQLDTINEDSEGNDHSASLLETINEDNDENPQMDSISDAYNDAPLSPTPISISDFSIHRKEAGTIYSSSSSFSKNDAASVPVRHDPSNDDENRQKESELFVSIGVLLANSLFNESQDDKFQNSICVYLERLDKCTGMFDRVMTKSNLVMQILNSEKENVNMKSEESLNVVNLPLISKIVNDNHDSIPVDLKNEWNEYMKSFFERDEELQTNN